MINVGKRRLLACLGLTVVMLVASVACSDAALFGLLKSKTAKQATVKQSLVVFPFDKDAEIANDLPDNFGRDMGEYLRSILVGNQNYSVFLFEDRLAPIKRAKEDQLIKDRDINGPYFTDKPKAGKLAELLSTDLYLVGSVESYTYDRDKKVAEMTIKADVVVARTGKVVQEYLVAAKAEGTSAMDSDEVRSIAADKAAEALKEKLIGAVAQPVKTAVKKDKDQPKAKTPAPALDGPAK